jgi:tetratricopeptide (TPR) repeat protein
MAKYRKPPHEITEEPAFFLKHYFNVSLEWLKANRDQVLTGVLVIAVLFLASYAWKQYSTTRANSAWGEVTLSNTIPELEASLARFSDTAAAPLIKLRLADQYLATGNYDNAARLYSDVGADAGFSERDRARYSVSLVYEAQGKFDESGKVLQEVAALDGFWGIKAKQSFEKLTERRNAYAGYEAAGAAAKAASSDSTVTASEAAQAADLLLRAIGSTESAIPPALDLSAPATIASTDSVVPITQQ